MVRERSRIRPGTQGGSRSGGGRRAVNVGCRQAACVGAAPSGGTSPTRATKTACSSPSAATKPTPTARRPTLRYENALQPFQKSPACEAVRSGTPERVEVREAREAAAAVNELGPLVDNARQRTLRYAARGERLAANSRVTAAARAAVDEARVAVSLTALTVAARIFNALWGSAASGRRLAAITARAGEAGRLATLEALARVVVDLCRGRAAPRPRRRRAARPPGSSPPRSAARAGAARRVSTAAPRRPPGGIGTAATATRRARFSAPARRSRRPSSTVRERQARGLAPTPEEAVVRPHSAALGIRLLLDDRDAAVLGRSASAGRGRCVSWAAPREGDHIT